MNVPFAKMHGLGNDFVVIDQRQLDYALSRTQLVHIADRRCGAGCDQLLFLEPPSDQRADARYRVVNADGSPAEHCGNGIRCIARYIERVDGPRDSVMVEIDNSLYGLDFVAGDLVRVDMGVPNFEPSALPLTVPERRQRYTIELASQSLVFGAVSVGNPHAAIDVEAIEDVDVVTLGTALQKSSLFPASVNVGFAQFVARDSLRLRVFERGVGETYACGTGACAAVAIGRLWGRLDEQVTVALRGGDLLIQWQGGENDRLSMTGPATFVFEGKFEL